MLAAAYTARDRFSGAARVVRPSKTWRIWLQRPDKALCSSFRSPYAASLPRGSLALSGSPAGALDSELWIFSAVMLGESNSAWVICGASLRCGIRRAIPTDTLADSRFRAFVYNGGGVFAGGFVLTVSAICVVCTCFTQQE